MAKSIADVGSDAVDGAVQIGTGIIALAIVAVLVSKPAAEMIKAVTEAIATLLTVGTGAVSGGGGGADELLGGAGDGLLQGVGPGNLLAGNGGGNAGGLSLGSAVGGIQQFVSAVNGAGDLFSSLGFGDQGAAESALNIAWNDNTGDMGTYRPSLW